MKRDHVYESPNQPSETHEYETPNNSVQRKDLENMERKLLTRIMIVVSFLAFVALIAVGAIGISVYALIRESKNDSTGQGEASVDKGRPVCERVKCENTHILKPLGVFSRTQDKQFRCKNPPSETILEPISRIFSTF